MEDNHTILTEFHFLGYPRSPDQRLCLFIEGCIAQFYFFFSLGSTEDMFLLVMALDRYLAICKPLSYRTVMTSSVYTKLIVLCFVCGFLAPVVSVVLISRLTFCVPNGIDHFFCDFAPLLKLACTDTLTSEIIFLILSSTVICFCCTLILVSYIFIIRAVIRIPSSKGRQKAFSTCSSHLTVVILLYGTAGFVYLRPYKQKSFAFHKYVAFFYSMGIPLLNPLIYSLRSNDIKKSVKKLQYHYCSFSYIILLMKKNKTPIK